MESGWEPCSGSVGENGEMWLRCIHDYSGLLETGVPGGDSEESILGCEKVLWLSWESRLCRLQREGSQGCCNQLAGHGAILAEPRSWLVHVSCQLSGEPVILSLQRHGRRW